MIINGYEKARGIIRGLSLLILDKDTGSICWMEATRLSLSLRVGRDWVPHKTVASNSRLSVVYVLGFCPAVDSRSAILESLLRWFPSCEVVVAHSVSPFRLALGLGLLPTLLLVEPAYMNYRISATHVRNLSKAIKKWIHKFSNQIFKSTTRKKSSR